MSLEKARWVRFGLASLQGGSFAYVFYPVLFSFLLELSDPESLTTILGSLFGGLVVAGLGLLFLVGFLLLLAAVATAALLLAIVQLAGAVSRGALVVGGGLTGLIVGGLLWRLNLAPELMPSLAAGLMVGVTSALIMWRALSWAEPLTVRSSE